MVTPAGRWGDHELTTDGVVMALSQGVTPTDACAALTEVCTAALGYAQPVEEKPFQFDPGGWSLVTRRMSPKYLDCSERIYVSPRSKSGR